MNTRNSRNISSVGEAIPAPHDGQFVRCGPSFFPSCHHLGQRIPTLRGIVPVKRNVQTLLVSQATQTLGNRETNHSKSKDEDA
jgi:hypothetical protein